MFMSLLDTNETTRLFSIAAMYKFSDCTAMALHQDRWMPGYMYQDIKTLFTNARYMATRWRLMGGVTTPVNSIDESSFVCIQSQGHGLIRNIFGNVKPGMRVGIMAVDQCMECTESTIDSDFFEELRNDILEANQDETAVQTFQASRLHRVRLMPVIIPGAFTDLDESYAQPQYHAQTSRALCFDDDMDMHDDNAVLSVQQLTHQKFSSRDYIFPYSGIHSKASIGNSGRIEVVLEGQAAVEVTEMNSESKMIEWKRENLDAVVVDYLRPVAQEILRGILENDVTAGNATTYQQGAQTRVRETQQTLEETRTAEAAAATVEAEAAEAEAAAAEAETRATEAELAEAPNAEELRTAAEELRTAANDARAAAAAEAANAARATANDARAAAAEAVVEADIAAAVVAAVTAVLNDQSTTQDIINAVQPLLLYVSEGLRTRFEHIAQRRTMNEHFDVLAYEVPLLTMGALWELGTITTKPEDMPTKYDRYKPGSASVSLMDNDELNSIPTLNILYNVQRVV